MVSVAELLELTLFDDFCLISGEKGLQNEVNSIAILEYESYQKNYEVFSPGDFILTSLFFAKDNPELITEAMIALMNRQVSGIAVKTMFFDALPQAVLTLSKQYAIPVFLFRKAYMEDLIISANELFKSKLQYLFLEEKITSLIETQPNAHTVAATAREINYHFYPFVTAVYLTPRQTQNRNAIANYFLRLAYKRYRMKELPIAYSYVKYRQGMLFFLSFTEEENPVKKDSLWEIVRTQLQWMDLNFSDFYIGINDSLFPVSQLHIAISQAITANRVCQLKKSSYCFFSQCDIYQLLCPLLSDASFLKQYEDNIHLLTQYDEKYTSNLLSTLFCFVACNGQIADTAQRMYQHPNTIRYRLKKISSLWSLSPENLYNHALFYMKAYELLEHTVL